MIRWINTRIACVPKFQRSGGLRKSSFQEEKDVMAKK
uniref:Uncharacterized protein n=1 Tax=Arundo donax TaxID=35708 RepID=A0A0A9DY26_ARUDO